MTSSSLEPSILFHYIMWVDDWCDSDSAMTVTCGITFCLLCLSSNEEKENKNSKQNKEKIRKIK